MADDRQETGPRPDLAAVFDRRAENLDAARPEKVAKWHARGRLTARENIDAFADAESFVEYGMLARPARKDMSGASDGIVMGTARADGAPVCLVAYDYLVYAGTQSAINHRKIDRMFDVAQKMKLATVCWVEGGGARPHDMTVGRLGGSTTTFVAFARLSGLVPTVAILAGRAFAGNANLAGLADCLIATPGSCMGMAGPPLVEAALGKKYAPEEIGPAEVHARSGAIDIMVEDEREAAAVARKYLSYFRGRSEPGEAPDVMKLRDLVPESPRRAYDVRKAIEGIADIGSVMELKRDFGKAAVTALIKIEGHPVGVIANQPMYLAGAIDGPASDKTARFIGLCDAFDIPMLFLCDTPGLMVGPEVETTGLVRRSARILTALSNATAPIMTVVLRKAYGLGYYVMGSAPLDPVILLAWPTAEFGGMGLEGAVNIIWGGELEAEPDPEKRAALHKQYTDELKKSNTALELAARFDFDDVIDPAETRAHLAATLNGLPPVVRDGRKRLVDPW